MNVLLVCRKWRDVGLDPALWTWKRKIFVSVFNLEKLNIGRLQNIQEIQFHGNLENDQLCEMLCAMVRLSKLKQIVGLHFFMSPEWTLSY